jgi:hypothetical protein
MDFINEYWKCVGSDQHTHKIRQNKHLQSLDQFLIDCVELPAKLEMTIPCKYRKEKKWDIFFPSLQLAIEYKTITSRSIQKCKYLRIEEGLGSCVDAKEYNIDLKLGYIIIFAFDYCSSSILKSRDIIMNAFKDMVDDNYYDLFYAIQTNGPDHYEFLTGDLNNLLGMIKNV